MPDTRKPRKQRRGISPDPPAMNPAVAALGAGAQPDRWEAAAIIERLTERYLHLIEQAEQARAVEHKVKARVLYGGAHEVASIIASYYQDTGNAEEHERWGRREKLAHHGAYASRNAIAESIGAPETQGPTSE